MNVSDMCYPACHMEEDHKVWEIYSLPTLLVCLCLIFDQIYHINHIQTHIQFVSAVSEHQGLCDKQHSTQYMLNMC